MSPESKNIVDAVRSDPRLSSSIAEIEPFPLAPDRIFRVQWMPGAVTCLLKVGLGELEALWMPEICKRSDDIVPRVRAWGSSIGDLNLSWLVMDYLPHRGRSDSVDVAQGVMRVAARFQQEAEQLDLPAYPIDSQFVQQYARMALAEDCPGPVTEIIPRIERDDAWLRSLGSYVLCHGDVHFWNAVAANPDGPWRLIDPIPRLAHWAWDAAYAQMTSGVPETPDLIALLADARRQLHLPMTGIDHLDEIRVILLGWSSMLWWAILPDRRKDPWWVEQVSTHVQNLAYHPLPMSS